MVRTKNDNKRAMARIVVVEARNLPIERSKQCNVYCSLQLKNQKERTRSVAIDENPIWKDTFEFHLYGELQDQQQLHVKIKYQNPVHKKDNFTHNNEIGKLSINLGTLKHENTIEMLKNLEGNGNGKLRLFVTISGLNNGTQNLCDYQPSIHDKPRLPLIPYAFDYIGKLHVSIHAAEGLESLEILGGKPEIFCIISLGHQFRQTQTTQKAFAPTWNRHFEFSVVDVCDCLDISVLDEQKDKKHRLLGRLKIPLLQISDSQKKWYQLKDNDLRTQAKGNNPKILLQFSFSYNTGNVSDKILLG